MIKVTPLEEINLCGSGEDSCCSPLPDSQREERYSRRKTHERPALETDKSRTPNAHSISLNDKSHSPDSDNARAITHSMTLNDNTRASSKSKGRPTLVVTKYSKEELAEFKRKLSIFTNGAMYEMVRDDPGIQLNRYCASASVKRKANFPSTPNKRLR